MADTATQLPSRVYTIAGSAGFADTLARGVLRRFQPVALADLRILLPTRRSCRVLGDSFLRAVPTVSTLLPNMLPIGDLDEDEIGFASIDMPELVGNGALPPPMGELHRQLLLIPLIMKTRDDVGPAHAIRLARDLAALLDEIQTERLDFSRLDEIVPERFAEHWQETLGFLRIVTRYWPDILADQGYIDPADHRNRLIETQVRQWLETPPQASVIAAGSTGSIPATADLLACVAGLENGVVILPGLDRTLEAGDIESMGPGHPQFAMVRLLQRLGLSAQEIPDWETGVRPGKRLDLVNRLMRPPETANLTLPEDMVKALSGVTRIECPGPNQEALVIAMLLREALECPGRTAALVTADRRLARRVAAELRRWKIEIDDSGGTPLADTLPGAFMLLTAEAVAAEAAPVPLLAALKHPLAAGGLSTETFRSRVRGLELAVLRGRRPDPGFRGLTQAVSETGRPELLRMAKWLENQAGNFEALLKKDSVPVTDLLEAHVVFAETLAATRSETGRLWEHGAGEALDTLIGELRQVARVLPPISGREWPAFLFSLMAATVVRPTFGLHPRLHIWSLIEARLQTADLLVMGGLNEGSWPPQMAADPWMSRLMRIDIGLPPPERRTGLAAHDFVQGFAAESVVLTRSTRVEGSPTVPSRWLSRLETQLSSSTAGKDILKRWREEERKWLQWQTELNHSGPAEPAVCVAGACPPLASRPDHLSVTEVETLVRDPYAIYARHVLQLRPLRPLDEIPGLAERGMVIHAAIEEFLRQPLLPEDALDRLLDVGRDAFEDYLQFPLVQTFWWPRFERIAHWIVEQEIERRTRVVQSRMEIMGEIEIRRSQSPFRLTARADRIDRLKTGELSLIDYKTGNVPSRSDVSNGLSPQLTLEAAMVRAGGFPMLGRGEVADFSYWHLTGSDPAGQVSTYLQPDVDRLADEALSGFGRLLDYYGNPESRYLVSPDPEIAPRTSDYSHLERRAERGRE